MADHSKKIVLRGAVFDERTASDICRVEHFDEADAEHFRAGIESGLYNLLSVEIDGDRRGSIILSWERGDTLTLFCNVLSAEHVPGVNIVSEIVEMMAVYAKAKGAGMLRFWTRREGLVRITEQMGFTRNYVMERAV